MHFHRAKIAAAEDTITIVSTRPHRKCWVARSAGLDPTYGSRCSRNDQRLSSQSTRSIALTLRLPGGLVDSDRNSDHCREARHKLTRDFREDLKRLEAKNGNPNGVKRLDPSPESRVLSISHFVIVQEPFSLEIESMLLKRFAISGGGSSSPSSRVRLWQLQQLCFVHRQTALRTAHAALRSFRHYRTAVERSRARRCTG